MGQQTPIPNEGDFENKRDYLFAMARHPQARPRIWLAETPLDVSREDPPVTIAYEYEATRGAIRVRGVFRGAEEVAMTPRETDYVKTWLRSIHRPRTGE